MNWGRGYGKWNLDHATPCAAFNLLDTEQFKVCFHYSNYQPMWAVENMQKSDKILPYGKEEQKS